ncbi:MAG: efflux RND transporter periplasmic adaptor subunit [Ignavibacteriaceae bacterium]|nr:efflux RND transporter periplasmic adaptor subunit [Ignavibacterium sp.]MCC6254363.1 efflux RND transporter periplasmic adaptor subunit [Ignavibacteriaceae bacterium]HRN25559.1 efflux RND transporter periplasmic adaptor subunit [Ignavibacteriaceae bacterium]
MKNKLFRTILFRLVFAALSIIFIVSCGNDNADSKNKDQMGDKEVIPVRVEQIKYQPFEKYLTFFSKLTGVKEATKGAMVGGNITSVNSKIGDYVKEGQVVVEFDTDNPALQYNQAKATFENAEKNYLRLKALYQAGETALASFEGAETQYQVAKRNYQSLRRMLFIEAPFDGYIVDLKVNSGDGLKSEAPLFTVAQLFKMRSKIWVSEKEIVQFKKGMRAVTEFGGQKFIGKIVEIAMAMDPAKQAFYVEVEFDNPRGVLKSGITNEIKILTYENPNAIIISRNLVMQDENGSYIYVVSDSKASKRYISNGNESGMLYEIKSGLKVDELLIVKGASQLEDGSKIKVIQ